MERAFYVSLHFNLKDLEQQLKKTGDQLFLDEQTNSLYRKRRLYNFGWGQETGFERLPPLSFQELIALIEIGYYTPRKPKLFHKKKLEKDELEKISVSFSNYYGAAAVIMEDHIEEFIDFLSLKIQTDYFANEHIRQCYKAFCFDTAKEMAKYGFCKGGILTESYEEVLNKYPKWHTISDKVKQQVYESNTSRK